MAMSAAIVVSAVVWAAPAGPPQQPGATPNGEPPGNNVPGSTLSQHSATPLCLLMRYPLFPKLHLPMLPLTSASFPPTSFSTISENSAD